MVSQTPGNFTLFSGHLKFFSGKSFSLLPAIEPIHKASVFLLLSLRPDSLPKFSIVLSVANKDSFVPLSIKVVLSGYWLILISDFFIVIPLISLLDLIALARISADRIKRYGERGQPCLTLLCKSKKLLAHPLFRTQLSIFL